MNFKKILEPKHITTLLALLLLALSTGIFEIKPEYTKWVAFAIGALSMFGHGVPKGFNKYIPELSRLNSIDNEIVENTETVEKIETRKIIDLGGD